MVVRRSLLVTATAILVAAAATGCGKEESPDLVNGKQLFTQRCGSCHILDRAGTSGTIGPSLDSAFGAARRAGLDEETIQGVVRQQIAMPRKGSVMPADLVTGDDARDVAAYVATAAAVPGEDQGELAQAGLAGARDGEQIFNAAGCNGCHTLAKAGSRSDIGPSLDDLARMAAQRRGGQSAREYVREAILEPDEFIVEGYRRGVMPSDYDERLEPQQVNALVDYLLEGD